MVFLAATLAALSIGAARLRPTMDEFVGLNVHTVMFRPALYRPVARLLRNYHPVEWDLGSDPSHYPQFPMARNGVDWSTLYGQWRKDGYRTSASLMFETIPPDVWRDPEDAYAYGYAVGRYFGKDGSIESVEIGNEPGAFSDAQYRTLFESMASGVRRASTRLRIAPCAIRVGPSGKYHKSVDCLKGLGRWYDVLNIHTYSELEPWPTFRRAHPEHPTATFLQPVEALARWRDRNAPDKPIWVTEFGWDASSKAPDPGGEWAKWVGNSEVEQAQYLVRAFLELARLPVQRAYAFWFNDDDLPQMHGSSGLTRRYEPKPSFHAIAHLRSAIGGYRFTRDVLRQSNELYGLEFQHGSRPDEFCWVFWVPTADGSPKSFAVSVDGMRPTRIERMPLGAGPPRKETPILKDGRMDIEASGSPTYVFMRRSNPAQSR